MTLLDALIDETIVRGRNHTYYYHSPQPTLSIKTMRNGAARYDIEGGRFAVSDDVYLILNHEQAYTIQIESPTIVQSFCVFFPYGWVDDVRRGLTLPDEALLANIDTGGTINFFERLHPHDSLVTPLLGQIERVVVGRTADAAELEAMHRVLLARLLHVQFNLYRETECIPAARAATRHELYRRLHRARDYIQASLVETLTLEQMAAVACLSPYHFLRAFKQVFGITPHYYLTQARLERAVFLLRHTRLSVTDICFEVGFQSLGSFSTRFQQHTGLSPRAFRQQAAV